MSWTRLQQKVDADNLSQMIKHVITQYEFYCNDTLAGERGKTASSGYNMQTL